MNTSPTKPRVVFAGTPEFAQVALQAILDAGIEVPLVLTQPDRPAGRGLKLQASPVKQLAEKRGISVIQPTSLRLDGKYAQEAVAAKAILESIFAPTSPQATVMVVAAYGLILPQWVLDLPSFGCINIHASLLPRWRGAAPILRAIEAGDMQTGVCIMQMDAGLDTGDVLLQSSIDIDNTDTTATLHDKLAKLGADLCVTALKTLQDLTRQVQSTQGITYAHKINKAESLIDWTQPAQVLARKVRAFNPYPVCAALWPPSTVGSEPERLKIWTAQADQDHTNAAAGTILQVNEDGIYVACGQGTLILNQLQRAGGKRLSTQDWLRGFPMHKGQQFVLPSTIQTAA